MFYLIIAIMLLLFYIFFSFCNVKGTMNLVASVFLLVGLVIVLILGILKVVQSPPEIWLCIGMIVVGFWAMWDIYHMPRSAYTRKK